MNNRITERARFNSIVVGIWDISPVFTSLQFMLGNSELNFCFVCTSLKTRYG